MQIRSRGVAGLAVALLVATPASPLAQSPSLDDVLSRMGAYVSDFIPRFANVVTVETYEQHTYKDTATGTGSLGSGTGSSGSIRERVVWRLRSDLLLVRYPMGELDWMMFRDVAEVNAKPVRHAEGRLISLFTRPVSDAEPKAALIAAESARYHIPGGSFAVTNPLLVVALAQPHYQPRLQFTLGGEERSLGPGVRVLRFEEREASPPRARGESQARAARPTLLEGGRVRGNIWVEPKTGRIVKTEARIGTGQDVSTTITTFVPDARLGIMVPMEMRTTWPYRGPERVSQRPVTGVATYGDFRRFEVRTDASVAPPSQP